MKALKRFLLLALALIMGLSLFACSSNDSDPADGNDGNDNNNDNPSEEVVLSAPDILDYVFDAQILKDNAFSIAYKDEPTNVIFSGYELGFTVEDGYVNVFMEEDMIDKSNPIQFVDANDKGFAELNVTVNPLTENYYNVTADTASAGYTIATTKKATEVKFNGVAVGNGVTITDTGINFAKSLFTSETMGHNKVEFVVDKVQYVLSLCAVTQKELDNPITFEDGKQSPFVYVYTYGEDAKVVDVFEQKGVDGTSPLVDPSLMRYYISADGNTETENRNQLRVKGDSLVYIASYYLNARVKKLEQRQDFGKWADNKNYMLVAKGYCGSTDVYKYNAFKTATGEKPKDSFSFSKWVNAGPDFSTILDYTMYQAISSEYGAKYIYIRVPMGNGTPMYLDDIAATLDNYDTHPECNGGTMWFGGNSRLHCQNTLSMTDQPVECQAFRVLMDKVCLED